MARELELEEQMFGLDESFAYVVCKRCETLFIREIPSQLSDYYTKKYYSLDFDPEAALGNPIVAGGLATVGRSSLLGRGLLSNAARRLLRGSRQVQTTLQLFESIHTAGLPRGDRTRILDVGSGAGALVYALSIVGFDGVTGVDPFIAADRTFGRGGTILRRELHEIRDTYDLIMLHHSLEHVPDPAATLSLVRARLAPAGKALVRMPTVSSDAFRRYDTHWAQLDPPRHLTLFSREGVARLCADVGLVVERVVDDSTAFQFWASEQWRCGVPLMAPNSHFVNPARSVFSRGQLRRWRRAATALNDRGRGDQAAWVLRAP